MRAALARLAADSPVPIFVLAGQGAAGRVDGLRLDPRLRLVDSPRAASLLLVAGRLPRSWLRPALRIHAQMPHPRVTVWWPLGYAPRSLERRFAGVVRVAAQEDVAAVLVRLQQALLRRERASEPDLLPDVDPAPWRGVGPYGQGGKGMTGGVPFGRPLATRAADRDGLELDFLPIRVGPFFPPLPVGLVLELRSQGDLLQEARVVEPAPGRPLPGDVDPVFLRALAEPVPLAALERARARHHLRWLAGMLRFHGLHALAGRALALAEAALVGAAAVRALGRLLERTLALGWATRGVGIVPPEQLRGQPLGPVARAAGLAEDARSVDPAYRALGFTPVTHREGDAHARWRQRLAEAAQALELAERAGDRLLAGGEGVVEAPRGRLTAGGATASPLLELLPALLAGQEWGDAMATVVSLDLPPVEPVQGASGVAA